MAPHGAFGDAQCIGDSSERTSLEVAEIDHEPLLRGEQRNGNMDDGVGLGQVVLSSLQVTDIFKEIPRRQCPLAQPPCGLECESSQSHALPAIFQVGDLPDLGHINM